MDRNEYYGQLVELSASLDVRNTSGKYSDQLRYVRASVIDIGKKGGYGYDYTLGELLDRGIGRALQAFKLLRECSLETDKVRLEVAYKWTVSYTSTITLILSNYVDLKVDTWKENGTEL